MVPSGRIRLLDWGGFVVASAGADGTIWFADSREYRVYRRTLQGDTTLVFSLPAEPAPLGEVEREHVRESGEHLGRMTLPSPVPLEPNGPSVVHVAPEYHPHAPLH